jgi:hypothetical protein
VAAEEEEEVVVEEETAQDVGFVYVSDRWVPCAYM